MLERRTRDTLTLSRSKWLKVCNNHSKLIFHRLLIENIKNIMTNLVIRFCFESEGIGKQIWICVDIRHKRDYFWFLENYPDRIKRVRITADQEVRVKRGWNYTVGVDDGPSECDLDDVTDWDLVITNNGNEPQGIEPALETVSGWIDSKT